MTRRIDIAHIGEHLAIAKVIFRQVAGSAGDRIIRAEAAIEEERMTERDRVGVVADRV